MGYTRVAAGLISLLAISAVVAACGSDDGGESAAASNSSASGDAACSAAGPEAVAKVEAALEPPKWRGPSEPVDVSKVDGEVWVINFSNQVPFIVDIAEGVKSAADAAGVPSKIFDGLGDPLEISKGIQEAINANAAGIVMVVDPATVAQPVKEAGDAGIPVVAAAVTDKAVPPVPGEFGVATWSFAESGKLQADWVAQDSNCEANILELRTSDFGSAVARSDGFVEEIEDGCPSCELTVENVKTTEIATQVPNLVKTAVQRNPDLGYVHVPFDAVAFPVEAALKELGKAKVKIVGSDAAEANLDAMRKQGLQAFDIGTPPTWIGWAALDQVARGAAGLEPADEYVPERAFVQADLPETNTETDLYGDADFQGEFKSLWGLN